MNAFSVRNVTILPIQLPRGPLLSVPVLIAVCWLLLQKGCVWNPDISPTHAVVNAVTAVTPLAPADEADGLQYDRVSAAPPFLQRITGPHRTFKSDGPYDAMRPPGMRRQFNPVPAIDHTASAFARWRATGGLIDHQE